jgi:hypothetical protein
MITIENYFEKFESFSDYLNSEGSLLAAHDFLVRATDGGKNFETYYSSDKIRKTIDIFLSKINDHLTNNTGKKQDERSANLLHVAKPAKQKKKSKENTPAPTAAQQHEITDTIMVERIPEELKFIKRFVGFNGKTKSKEQILSFINSLQKAIVEKRIRKTSTWADQIRIVQNKLIGWYNGMKQKVSIDISKEKFYDELKALVHSEAIMPSISFIKRYISLNGKSGIKDKARKLLEQINKAIDKRKLSDSDPYISVINDIKRNIEEFLSNSNEKVLQIEKAELKGLEGILGCACQNLNGLESKPAIMSSMDFANLEFDTLGFTGKWLELIGDPSSNFSAMVFGKPKMGKSYLCVDFAGYLARHHGKVLYVAKEEGLDMTLQKKLNEKHVAHPNLFVASVLPFDLSKYDFIFLDSVNRMGLSPEDLNNLKAKNPAKSFIFIFQTTKSGQFRGANTFQHDVDVVIEVPEKGKAVQMGRFNQGGEIDIFEKGNWRMAA